MKYAVFFLLFCVAMAAAAPQLIPYTWGGYAPGIIPAASTVVAGPTVVNTPWAGLGGRYIAPGYIGSIY